MNIKTLAALKENEVFKLLNQKQSEHDANDPIMLKDRFTRSPIHAIQFLIVYAGLDSRQREQVVAKLDANIRKEQLDALVNDIDWVAVLKAPKQSTTEFEFTIAIADEDNFLGAIKPKCPKLHEALTNSKQSIVKIEEKADQVVFTTKIAQKEEWRRPFDREAGDDFWNVPDFRLSDELQAALDELEEGQQRTLGGFRLKKGRGPSAKRIELHIDAPRSLNQISIASHIETNTGIYEAFVGLANFYGLEHVDSVDVEISNKAEFSDIGCFASQTQINSYVMECACMNHSTVVEVKELNVFFEGAGIVANFAENTTKTEAIGGPLNPQLSVELLTKGKENTRISLLAHAPAPRAAFELNSKVSKSDLIPLEDVISEQELEATMDCSFYLKCLAGLAIVAGGAMIIVGLAMTNPLLFGLGVATLITSSYTLFGLFAYSDVKASGMDEIISNALPNTYVI